MHIVKLTCLLGLSVGCLYAVEGVCNDSKKLPKRVYTAEKIMEEVSASPAWICQHAFVVVTTSKQLEMPVVSPASGSLDRLKQEIERLLQEKEMLAIGIRSKEKQFIRIFSSTSYVEIGDPIVLDLDKQGQLLWITDLVKDHSSKVLSAPRLFLRSQRPLDMDATAKACSFLSENWHLPSVSLRIASGGGALRDLLPLQAWTLTHGVTWDQHLFERFARIQICECHHGHVSCQE